MSTKVKNYKLLEIPENFKKVCQDYKPVNIFANLMPKCGTMYTRQAMAKANIWPKHKPDSRLLHRGDHYVASNSNLVSGMRNNRGWIRNQTKLEFYPNRLDRPRGYGNPLSCKKFWFTVVRNPFNLLVTYYTFGWPWDRHEIRLAKCNQVKGNKKFPLKIYSSFDYFIKSYCDPEFKWLVPASKNFLFFPIFDDEGFCRNPFVFRLEHINFCLETLCDNFGRSFSKPARRKSSRPPEKSRDEWKSWYSEELYDLVNNKISRELVAFGYDFDGIEKEDKRKILDCSNVKYFIDKDEMIIEDYNSNLINEILEKNTYKPSKKIEKFS
tara:strand:- start:1988 stop:2962 length:975 start_codon:yes stop_codon:yes gene_type:complete